MGIASRLEYIPIYIALIYFTLSLVTLIVYWVDKSKAKRNVWRTPESTLHFLALFGGWPGAAIGQHIFRHKTQKKGFRLVFWLTIVINCGVIAWLLWSKVLI